MSFVADTLYTVSTKIGSSVLLWHLGKNSERVRAPHLHPAPDTLQPFPSYPSLYFLKEVFISLVR